MKRFISLIVLVSFTLLAASCAEIEMNQLVATGIGVAVGAGAGYALGGKKHKIGGMIGGAVVGGLISKELYELAKKTRKKAAVTGATEKKPFIQTCKDGSVLSYVVDTDNQGCKRVRSITIDKKGNVLGDKVDSVCGKA